VNITLHSHHGIRRKSAIAIRYPRDARTRDKAENTGKGGVERRRGLGFPAEKEVMGDVKKCRLKSWLFVSYKRTHRFWVTD
jgi:hypothetical protein